MALGSTGKSHMSLLGILYKRALSEESRYWLYKMRHPGHFRHLRQRVSQHAKGDFSIQPFFEKKAIFVHITKAAGTSTALSLLGALPSHYTAWQYRVIFGRKAFNRYFKFTFVRNPWDRLYSAYSFLRNGGWDEQDHRWAEQNLPDSDDFNDFVLNWMTPEKLYSHIHFWPQSRFVLDRNGKLLVDYIGYFETIHEDFAEIAKRLDTDASLSHTNASPRMDYRSVYSSAAVQKVQELYREDIELFGYEFNGIKQKFANDIENPGHGV